MRTSISATPLASIAHIEMGQSPDSSTVLEGDHGGVPFLQGNAEFGTPYPTPRFTCTAPMKMCRAGDILMSVRAPVGAMNIADRDYCIGRGLAAIRVAGMSPTLASHMVSTAVPALRRVAQGTTFEAISKTDLASVVVMVPPQEDREPLSRVLDTLDTTIRQTEAIIEKLKHVKQGLLHDLLTRGIDANGELRPPQSQAPHLYKDSLLGWIPCDWTTPPVSVLVRQVTYGFTNPMPTTLDGPWMLTAADIADGHVDYSAARKTSSREFARLSRKSRPSKGDILVTKDGTLGRVALLDRENVCVNQSVAVLSPLDAGLGAFLTLYLRSPRGQDRMIADAGGSTIKHIYITTLADMLVPGPPVAEAFEIGQRADALEQRIQLEVSQLLKLGMLKSGLMDDLLTGRVRVTPLLQSEAAL